MSEVEKRKRATVGRVEAALGAPLVVDDRDLRLPDGRRLIICYSKPHHDDRDFYIGIPNRVSDDDALIVGLGEDDVVFPTAAWLLQYAPLFSQSNDGRANPRFRRHDNSLVLSLLQANRLFPLDALVGNYGALRAAIAPDHPVNENFGRRFTAPSVKTSKAREPFSVDPDAVDRGTKAHADTVVCLAEHLQSFGLEPLDFEFPEPPFDLGWIRGSQRFVAEIKSVTFRNEERQLRLGLGQVLRYRHAIRAAGHDCVAVLAPEREPSDPSWSELCESLAVRLVWPGNLESLTEGLRGITS